METLRIPSIPPELGVRASKAAPVLIATDGRLASDAALVVGRMLAGGPEALRVITVIKPMPLIPESEIVISDDLVTSRRAAVQRHCIAQMTRTWDCLEQLEIREGDPATVMSRIAHESGATMIVCGLGRHRVVDRVFGDETALRLVRLADVPVFAVSDRMNHAPTRIVVAVDFSETSLRAARMAIELASTNATLYLVHSGPRAAMSGEWEEWTQSYRSEAASALQAMREQLRPPADMIVEEKVLEGDPATEILAFAAGVNADLIATGSHGHGFLTRMLVGSVATRIIRTSTCSVLSVPHAAVMTDAGVPFSWGLPGAAPTAK